MTKNAFLIGAVIAFLMAVHPAGAGTEFKGGDQLALEFQNAAGIAIREVEADVQDFPVIEGRNLEDLLAETKILVSDDPLFVESNGVRQESAAVNSRAPDTIIINRSRWSAIQSQEVKNALALHEVLGIAGIEDTGLYPISSAYLALRGIRCAPDVCSAIPVDVGPFSFEKAQVAFEGGAAPKLEQVLGNWLEVGVADIPTERSPTIAQYSDTGALSWNGFTKVYLSFKKTEAPLGGSGYTVTYSANDNGHSVQVGPDDTYSVVSDSTEMHFATSGMVFPVVSKANPDDGFFYYSCRLFSADRLLCAGTFSQSYSGIPVGQVVRYLLLEHIQEF